MATAKKAKPAAGGAAAAAAPAKKKAAAAATTKTRAAAAASAPAAPAAAASKKRTAAAAAAPTPAAAPKAATAATKKQRTVSAAAAEPAAAATAAKKPRRRSSSSASSDVRAALLAARHLRPPQRAEAAAKAALALPGVDRARVERACASLIRFAGERAEREAASALPMGDDVQDEALQLLVALRKAPGGDGGKRKDKPVQLDVPHPMWTLNNARGGSSSSSSSGAPAAQICLFVRDDNKGSGHKAAKLRLSKIEGGAGVSKVIGTSKLRGKYESHEAKRKLCAAYDLFLADDRILPSLPKLLGKQFFKRRKQPLPVRLSGGPGTGWRDLPAAVKRAAASAHLFPPRGTTVTVRCARVAHGASGAADNVLAALAGVVGRIPKGWANVSAAYVKTSDSVALPLYQSAAPAPGEEEAARAEARAMLLDAKRKRRSGGKGVKGKGGKGGDGGGGDDDDSE